MRKSPEKRLGAKKGTADPRLLHAGRGRRLGGGRAQLPNAHGLPDHAEDRPAGLRGPGAAPCGPAPRLGPADHRGAGRFTGQQGTQGPGGSCVGQPGREPARPGVIPQQGAATADAGHLQVAPEPGYERDGPLDGNRPGQGLPARPPAYLRT